MEILIPTSKIELASSNIPGVGVGVFASEDFEVGEIIEVCNLTFIPPTIFGLIVMAIFRRHLYFFGEHDEQRVIAQGFGRYYNHSSTGNPNATYDKMLSEKTIVFRAVKKIAKGKEILVDYARGNPECIADLIEYGIH